MFPDFFFRETNKFIGTASSQAIESRFGISVKDYPRNNSRLRRAIFGVQKLGGAFLARQKWGGAKKKKLKKQMF